MPHPLTRSALLALAISALPATSLAAEPSVRLDLGGGVSLDLVLVDKGHFTQGSPPGEVGRELDERPRSVSINRPYYIGKYPVTVAQFTRFATDAGYRTEAERGASGGSGWDGRALVQKKEFTWRSPGFPQTPDHPVTLVTFDDAQAFAGWLSRRSGRVIALPTEAEWEHAYRAGSSGAYYAPGDTTALGWFKENAGNGTRPVGQKKPNAIGLFDMAGNVNEWCADWYAPYAEGATSDPREGTPDASDKPRRVLRGGSWLRDAKHGRAAARYRNTPGSRNADNGFRVVSRTIAAADVTPLPQSEPIDPPPAQPPPATPAPQRPRVEPAVVEGPSAKSGLLFMGVIGVGLVGVIISAIFMLRGGAQRHVRLRPAPDGFWIHAPRELAGATLRYRHRGPAGWQEGSVILEPSDAGQFVYTGAAPRMIEEIGLVAAGGPRPARAGAPAPARSYGGAAPSQRSSAPRPTSSSGSSGPVIVHHVHHDHHHHHDDDRDEPFRGYPSAY